MSDTNEDVEALKEALELAAKDNTALRELRTQKAKVKQLEKSIKEWMDDQAKRRHLCRNGDAPMWHEYETACAALIALREKHGV